VTIFIDNVCLNWIFCIRRLNIEIAQSLQAGEIYTDMAIRIENDMGWTRKKGIVVTRVEEKI